jgi:hypothetical protein
MQSKVHVCIFGRAASSIILAKEYLMTASRQQRPFDKRSFRELGLSIDWSRQYPPCERDQTFSETSTAAPDTNERLERCTGPDEPNRHREQQCRSL